MRRILPHAAQQPPGQPPLPLYSVAQTRQIEQAAAARLPPHALMQRAGLALARLALALAPHARTVWLACGPGNNGGDGLEAALHLQRWGQRPLVTLAAEAARLPADAAASLARARAAGVAFASTLPPDLQACDLCIDALLGIGAARPPTGLLRDWLDAMHASPAPVLAVDIPTGLNADTGCLLTGIEPPDTINLIVEGAVTTPQNAQNTLKPVVPGWEAAGLPRRHTLTLLTLKPGLFTAQGRDAVGQLWFDDLGVDASADDRLSLPAPSAWLNTAPAAASRPHASHKGSWGDVTVIGGEGLAWRGMGMEGAALLAASAALHAGAGRVMLCLPDHHLAEFAPAAALARQPELMLRRLDALDLTQGATVCGCGGGQTIAAVLPKVLAQAARLVLDADALNAISRCNALRQALAARAAGTTVLTPHPLEAARLLDGGGAATQRRVQQDRLTAARALAAQTGAVVVLKGSGTVIATADGKLHVNPSGNARLAAPGTGDVLAGLIGAHLAAGLDALPAACHATWQHGALADAWPPDLALTASALARRLRPP